MLLIVGEPIVAYQRDTTADPDAPYLGPWPSGSPAICAYVAGRLGTPTTFVGAVGADEHGDVMRDGLRAGNVDVDHMPTDPMRPTAWARVNYHRGEREFDFHVTDSAATVLTSADLGDLPERADWLHLSGSALVFGGALADTALEALHRAKLAGSRISVDPNVRPESLAPGLVDRLRAALRLADYVLPSTGELESLDVDPMSLVAGGSIVCVTHGERGASVTTPEGTEHVPAVDVAAVDTDGAGDSFAAGFVTGILARRSPVEAARLGAAIAAEAVTEHGPMTATFARFMPVP